MKKRMKIVLTVLGLFILIPFFLIRESLSADENIRRVGSEPTVVNLKETSLVKSEKEAKTIKTKSIDSFNKQFEIQLRSRKFTAPEDVRSAIQSHIRPSKHTRVHVLMQFYDIPDVSKRGILKSAGVNLLNYIPHKAWFVSVPRGVIQAQLVNANVRWIGPILPEDKIFPPILNRGVASWAVNSDGSLNLEVSIFKDVSLDEARGLLVGMGAIIKEESTVSNRLTVTVSPDTLMDIANEDIVRWIIEERPPKKHCNDGSRANVGADAVQTSPYNLSGSNVDVGIWDGGDVDSSHDDFGARATVVDSAGVDSHATHVAGTMGGDGTLSSSNGGTANQWKGMAPQMDIISYLWDNNITDHDGAINTYGIELSQNSWGYDLIGPPAYPEYYGYYGWDAPEYDDIITGFYGKKISVVFAAGNDRDNVSGDYDTIGPPSTAKNIICVGAINSDDDSMTVFSGWGPMDDGRIKPDVVAPGDEAGGEGYIKSTLPGDTYGGPGWYGTSMAAPCVSGCASLIIEDYRSLYSGQDPLPSTVKALLIHEAKDLGNTGPDYSYGYGDIQIQDSIDKLRTKSLVEDDVGHNGTDTHYLYVPEGTAEVKITMVWDDESATEGAGSTLVNDLDLIVKDPSNNRYYPWTLDSANPSNPAVQTQEDHTNNVEQVVFNGSITSGYWTIEVYGNNVASEPPQDYSLILTPDHDNVIGKIYRDSGYSKETKFFDRTDFVYIEAYVISDGSPLAGATVTAALELMDGSPVTTIGLVDVGSGYYRNSWDSTGQTADVYSVDISVANPALSTREYFHIYPQNDISAYRLDYDEDGNDDYVLENKHLVAVYNGRTDTDKLLLCLRQKDTGINYAFGEISDADSMGTGEVTTTNMTKLRFSSFLFSEEGENLTSAVTLDMDVYINEPTTASITYYDISNGASFDANYIIDAGEWIAERFDPDDLDKDYVLKKVSIHIKNVSGGSYPLIVEIRNDSGNLPGGVLTSESIDKSSIPAGPGWYEVVFSSQITLSQAGKYWLVVRSDEPEFGSPSTTKGYTWTLDDTSPTYPGLMAYSVNGGSSWSSSNSYDGIFRAYGHIPTITTAFDLCVQMKTEDVDYLVYKLSGFNEYIDDIGDVFSPISGSLGSSVSDDRYHIGDGTDDLITSLTSGDWTNFSSLTDQQKYVAIYDDSLPGDDVDDNVISWVYFPNAATVSFQDVGCWYETGKEALRIRYDTSSATGANQAEYILAFTQGDFTAIEQWMSTVASGSYPVPNFMTSFLSVSVNPTTWTLGIISLNTETDWDSFIAKNEGTVAEKFETEGTNGEGGWQLLDAVGQNAFKVEVDKDNDSTSDFNLSTSKQTLVESVAQGADHYFKLKYYSPSSDTQGGGIPQDFTITITASKHIP